MRTLLLRLTLPLVLCQAVSADTVDFEGLDHGESVANQIPGLRVRAHNVGGGPDLAIVFVKPLQIPEPTALALAVLALASVAVRRRYQ